ncbi:MAG: hypothetical protein H0A75_03515 [Candidatus Methanofishera endochildressiae]|uniref:Uncharacterized protein n=1 Tax=Candidatus Methanofishera endochildressiae TaxID=2738884 RepID=A0A7Z0MNI7_9GAMM|nr:hypothetical protein [Candidatus Methanofishera endochildressiae]
MTELIFSLQIFHTTNIIKGDRKKGFNQIGSRWGKYSLKAQCFGFMVFNATFNNQSLNFFSLLLVSYTEKRFRQVVFFPQGVRVPFFASYTEKTQSVKSHGFLSGNPLVKSVFQTRYHYLFQTKPLSFRCVLACLFFPLLIPPKGPNAGKTPNMEKFSPGYVPSETLAFPFPIHNLSPGLNFF